MTASEISAPLVGLRVLEFGDHPAVMFCGWMFAAHGAEVVRVGTADVHEATDLFLHGDKERVLLPWRTLAPDFRRDISGSADIVIGGAQDDWDDVSAEAMHGILHDFGRGPYQGWQADELVLASLGGAALYTQKADGSPAPIRGRRLQFLAGMFLYTSLVAELATGPASRRVGCVEVSCLEAVVAMLPYLTTQVSYNGSTSIKEQSGPRVAVRCVDGWAVVYLGLSWANIVDFLRKPELADDERFVTVGARFRHVSELQRLADEACAGLSVQEACGLGRQCNVAVAPIDDVLDVLRNTVLDELGAWRTIGSRRGPLKVPRLPYVVDGLRLTPEGPGPKVPSATSIGLESGAEATPVTSTPLAGVRIADLTHVWSGPFATRLLAGLGAEVIKVENSRRVDVLRGNPDDLPLRYPDLYPGPDAINRSAWFNTHNTDKLSVDIDAKDPDGAAALRRLVESSDVLIANFRPTALTRMGLDAAELHSRGWDGVVVEMPGYQAEAPNADSPAFGSQFEAASGWCFIMGSHEQPVMTGFAIGDVVAGLFAAAAVVTMLYDRARRGVGHHVVVPQSQAMLALAGEFFVARQLGRDTVPVTDGSVRDCFPTAVAGHYLTLELMNDSDWSVFVGRLGRQIEVSDGGERSALVRAWAATVEDVAEAAKELQKLGLLAAPVADGRAVLDDPQLRHASFFVEFDHPSVGCHPYPGLPVSVAGMRIGPRRRAPLLGEHTAQVLESLDGSAARAPVREAG